MDQSMITAKTFRFATGEFLTLDQNQIEKIPYLTTLISAADYYKSIRDEHGYYKLDPHIDYEDFLFVLESLSFHSVRQIFTHLPEQYDVISIIALIDSLGLRPQSDPTLNEVDSTFFATLMHSPMLSKHLQIVRPCLMQEMAVRFAIGILNEEYDLTDDQVLDQIYWFIMFILSAYEYFGFRLRYHVYTIAEACFSVFKPSFLKPLTNLMHTTEKNLKTLGLSTNDTDAEYDEENECASGQHVLLNDFYAPRKLTFRWYGKLKTRQDLVLYHTHQNYDWYWYSSIFNEVDHMKPVYERILEIMYERLQSEICQRASIELNQNVHQAKFVQETNNDESDFYLFEDKLLPNTIEDLFTDEVVEEEIRKHIREDLDILIPKLKKRHAELMKEFKEYEQELEKQYRIKIVQVLSLFPSRFSKLQTMQKHISSYERILSKLEQESKMIEEIHQRVIDELYTVALKQFYQWKKTRDNINKLYYYLSSCPIRKTMISFRSKLTNKHHRISLNKLSRKRQLKNTWCVDENDLSLNYVC